MSDLQGECGDLPVREFEPGELIIEEGGRCGALFFLKRGKVEVVREGQRIALVEEPGAVLGEISVLLDRPHMAEVRAMGHAAFHVAEDAEAFLRSCPTVNLHIARILAKRVDAMGCYLADLKQQYAGEENHLGMVGEVLDSLMTLKQ